MLLSARTAPRCKLKKKAAHNELYGTDIHKGVIMMCSVDCLYQEFVLEGSEFDRAAEAWMDRVEKFSLLSKELEAQD